MSQPHTQPGDHDVVPLPVRSSPRRIILTVVFGLAAVAVLIWAARAIHYARGHESTDDAQIDGHIVPVLARVGGYISTVLVDDNDSVKAGQLLATIDSTEPAVRLAQADADYAAAVAAVAQAQAGQQVGSEEREAASAQIQAARAAAEKARNDLARAQQLAQHQLVSRQQLDAAQAASDAANASLEAAMRNEGAAAGGATSATAGVRAAEARLAAARAAREQAQVMLGYTRIAAPTDGVIAKRSVEPGQLVQVGQPLLAIVADTTLWVTANFKETQLAQMRIGQPTTIDVDAYPGCEAGGTVESLSPATGARFALLPPDNATGNYTKVVQRVPVRIRVVTGCGPAQPLRPGLSVTVHVATR